jgi:hypothetical protein
MASEGAGGLSTAAIERCIGNWGMETQDGDEIPAARAELAALLAEAGRATAPTVWLGVDPPLNEDERAMVYDPTVPGRIRLHLAILWLGELRAEAGRGAAGARDADAGDEVRCPTCGQATIPFYDGWGRVDHQPAVAPEQLADLRARAGRATALLDAAARYQDAWRALAAGDVDDGAKRAHILDMHEAREDLFDATEVALGAGGAGAGETEG